MRKIMLGFILLVLMVSAAEKNIAMPAPAKLVQCDLMTALQLRKSTDKTVSSPISDQQLSTLLWAANGINRPDGKRTAPSAFDTKCVVLYVVRNDGAYRYNAEGHSLTVVTTQNIKDRLAKQDDLVTPAPVVLVMTVDYKAFPAWTAIISKKQKYVAAAAGSGFIGQNVYLTAAALKLNTRYIEWLKEKELKKALRLPKTESPLCVMPISR